jgi:hypothetical protein
MPRTHTTIKIPSDLLDWIEAQTTEAITVAAVIISAIEDARKNRRFQPRPIRRGAPIRATKRKLRAIDDEEGTA